MQFKRVLGQIIAEPFENQRKILPPFAVLAKMPLTILDVRDRIIAIS
jgi:hypothetical protein